ncbi:MAG: secretin N-terminal domain-containing protein [Candidatus Firestonebacteria bacterium]
MKKIIIVFLIFQVCFVFAQDDKETYGVLGKVDVQSTQDGVTIVIPIEKGTLKAKVIKVNNPDRVVLDIFPAVITGKRNIIDVKDSIISQIDISQYQNQPQKVARIVARCLSKCEYKLSEDVTKIVLSITLKGKQTLSPTTTESKEEDVVEKGTMKSGQEVASSEESEKSGVFDKFSMKKGEIDQVVPYINLLNVDLPTFLNTIVTEAGFNLVTSKSVVGTIPSIQLRNVTLRKILDVVLKQNGFTYKLEGNIVRVATPAEMKAEEEDALIETKNFGLNFAKASDIVAAVTPFLSGKGKAQSDTRTNTLIVTDITIKLEVIEDLVKKLDTKTYQVEIEAKIVDVKFESEDKLGIRWDIETKGPTSLAGADIYPTSLTLNPNIFLFRGSVNPPTTTDARSGALQFGLGGDVNFWLSLDALIRNGEANLLANPKITTLDNKTATITATQAYSYVSGYNSQTGVTTYASVDAGVTLQVTPQVNRDNYVTLKVKPTVSSITNPGPPPIIDSRTAETEVLVKDGETLVIGGLIREDEVISLSKVPLLGDIPLIGSLLFQSKSTVKVKRDLVVLITPHIIK